MLRSSHKLATLHVGLSGYRVSVGSLRGGTWQHWPSEAEGSLSARAPSEALQAQLSALKLTDTSDCSLLDVVLETALTRVQVLRIPAGIRTPLERAAYLKASFRAVFGRDATDWHIISEQAYVGEPVPAIALDEKIMAAVTALSERHQLKLRSLRTSFIDCFNSLRRKLSAHTGAFALLENDRVCLGLWRNRNWVAMSTQAFVPGDGQALAALCAQMLARVDPPMPSGTLYIAGADKPFPLAQPEGWDVQIMETDEASSPISHKPGHPNKSSALA